jgi:hypothetical protein
MALCVCRMGFCRSILSRGETIKSTKDAFFLILPVIHCCDPLYFENSHKLLGIDLSIPWLAKARQEQ